MNLIKDLDWVDNEMALSEEKLANLEVKENDEKKKKYLNEYESYLKSDILNKNNKNLKGKPLIN